MQMKPLVVDLPENLHTEFKIACMRLGSNMKIEINKFVELFLKEYERTGEKPVLPDKLKTIKTK